MPSMMTTAESEILDRWKTLGMHGYFVCFGGWGGVGGGVGSLGNILAWDCRDGSLGYQALPDNDRFRYMGTGDSGRVLDFARTG